MSNLHIFYIITLDLQIITSYFLTSNSLCKVLESSFFHQTVSNFYLGHYVRKIHRIHCGTNRMCRLDLFDVWSHSDINRGPCLIHVSYLMYPSPPMVILVVG
jgi:hypothetical protein